MSVDDADSLMILLFISVYDAGGLEGGHGAGGFLLICTGPVGAEED